MSFNNAQKKKYNKYNINKQIIYFLHIYKIGVRSCCGMGVFVLVLSNINIVW